MVPNRTTASIRDPLGNSLNRLTYLALHFGPSMSQGWVGTGKSRDETRRDWDNVLNFFRDKTRRDIKTSQIHSRQTKTVKGFSRQDKTFKLSEI